MSSVLINRNIQIFLLVIKTCAHLRIRINLNGKRNDKSGKRVKQLFFSS